VWVDSVGQQYRVSDDEYYIMGLMVQLCIRWWCYPIGCECHASRCRVISRPGLEQSAVACGVRSNIPTHVRRPRGFGTRSHPSTCLQPSEGYPEHPASEVSMILL